MVLLPGQCVVVTEVAEFVNCSKIIRKDPTPEQIKAFSTKYLKASDEAKVKLLLKVGHINPKLWAESRIWMRDQEIKTKHNSTRRSKYQRQLVEEMCKNAIEVD